MSDKKTFYITTTLPYVNAEPHIGHAVEFIRADIIARAKKWTHEVFFNTGTDEHGQKVFTSALVAKKSVQEYVEQYAGKFKELLSRLGLSEDVHFIRTTDSKHIEAAQEFWRRVDKNGYIYRKNYKTRYCIGCEAEKTDSEIENNHCIIHAHLELEVREEENYFFKYSEFRDRLLNFYEANPQFIVPESRMNEMKEFVKSGLQDFSISRLKKKMPWGVSVLGDDNHVMYVWFDALVSYISTLGWPRDEANFEKFWVKGTPVQYCGKDNTRFQSAMWQAMLMAADLPNSSKIVVNGFVTGEGGIKMSKSLGNVINPIEIVNEYGTDALRYFVARELSNFEDTPFTKERFKDAYNANLANGLGNLVSRIMTMVENYNVGHVIINPKHPVIDNFDINKFTDSIWIKVQELDRKIQEEEPYRIFKSDKDKATTIVHELCTGLSEIANMLSPVMPSTSANILDYLARRQKPGTPLFPRKD